MNKSDCRKGMRVTATNGTRYPGNGVIEKVNPKSVDVTLDGGQKVRFDPMYLIPEGGEVNELEALVGRIGNPHAEVVPYVPMPMPGTIVRCTPESVARNPKLVGLWVFVGSTGDTARIFRVNNSDGRYWRVKPHQMVKVHATVTEVGVGV